MQRMMSTKEAASLWNISDRQVSKLCGEGKIKGAVSQRKKRKERMAVILRRSLGVEIWFFNYSRVNT